MEDPSTPLLAVRDVRVVRGTSVLIEGVTLDVQPGTTHALVGPNGAGKSTLVTAILGQIAFTGSITFHFRGSGVVGFVPQVFAVDRTLPITVAEFLALARQRRPVFLGVSRNTRRKTEELLERVGLAGFGPRRLSVLSGGELRRVLVANALDPTPEFLLLDEPTSGVDADAVAGFDEVLRQLRAAGTTTLLVSHDTDEVRRVADQVTLLSRTVKRTGRPAELLPAPASPA
jgi:zinc transport system ATP-binding protein